MPRKRPPKTENKPSNPYGLLERQWLFCQQFVIDENGAQAAIRAGYAKSGAKVHAAKNANMVSFSGQSRISAPLHYQRTSGEMEQAKAGWAPKASAAGTPSRLSTVERTAAPSPSRSLAS